MHVFESQNASEFDPTRLKSKDMETDIDFAHDFFRVSFVFMKSCVTTELGKLVQRLSSSFMSSIYAFTYFNSQ